MELSIQHQAGRCQGYFGNLFKNTGALHTNLPIKSHRNIALTNPAIDHRGLQTCLVTHSPDLLYHLPTFVAFLHLRNLWLRTSNQATYPWIN